MKEFLKKLIKAKEARAAELRELIKKSESADEVRALGDTLQAILDELNEAKNQLAEVESNEGEAGEEERSFNPVATYGNKTKTAARNTDKLSSMEYRKAFMDFVQRGVKSDILVKREAEQVSSDLGILLPNTIVNEVIKGVEKVYGQLYARVKKTNVKGGIQYPIGAFSATMYWDGVNGNDKEHGVTDNQKAGGINGYIQFTYHIGELRIAQSLLQSVVTVEAFESEIVKAILEAYVKSMDEVILLGDGVKQPVGIITEANKGESRIPASNIITFNADEMVDWKKWQTKLFAKIPLSMRSLRPEFVMTAETFESNIMTLEDANGRPVYRETYNPETGDEKATFKGRNVTFVEEGGIKSFESASAGEYFGMYWVPEKAYLVNTNMQFSYKKYFDESTNQYITKALVICDGKPLDTKYIYLLKKA